jgi:uncharacterized protein (TIGR03437 family)
MKEMPLMQRSVLTILTFASMSLAQTETFTYTYSGLPLPVYPDDWDTVAVASIFVPRSIVVSRVTATVQVQFSGVGDLNVYLWSAAGTRTKLLERNCGGLVNIDTTFDDNATSMFSQFCPAEAGRGPFKANEPLANSSGQNAFGFWVLGVETNGSDRTGLVTGFSITITGTVHTSPAVGVNTIVSTSGFQNGSVAPGDHVTILGLNLGPAQGIRADASQTLPASLGGTTVTFDGVPAPLFYVSDRLIALQAPFTLTPGSTRVQVVSTSGSSSAALLSVVPSKPGIFTTEAGGRGQAKAVNQDGTMNGERTPAAPGSVISVMATGLGQVNPPITAGTPPAADRLSTTVLPVSASIGGRPATVTFAGAAPGYTGVYQVNIAVPANAPRGSARLVLISDGTPSQAGVTVEVR